MTILFIVPELSLDGAVSFTLSLIDQLQEYGVMGAVFVLRSLDRGELPRGWAEHAIEGSPPGLRRRFAAPLALARLFGRTRRSDVIVSIGGEGGQLVAAVAAGRTTRRPVVAMAQSHPGEALQEYVRSDWTKRATRLAYRHLDAVVCASRGLEPPVLELGAPGEKVRVIGNGIDVERVRSLAAEPRPPSLPRGPI